MGCCLPKEVNNNNKGTSFGENTEKEKEKVKEKEQVQQEIRYPSRGRPYFNNGNSVLLPSVHSEENQNLISQNDKEEFSLNNKINKNNNSNNNNNNNNNNKIIIIIINGIRLKK